MEETWGAGQVPCLGGRLAVTYFTDDTDAPAQTGVPLANGLSPTDRP